MIMSGAIEKVLTDAHVILPNCNISSCYGGTDFGFVSGCMNDDPLQKRFTTDGRPLPGVEAKIIRDDGSNADVGEEGEILLKGLNCAGYYKQPDQNDQVFTSDGFFHTGDVGRIDDEGFIKLTGRLKDIIRRGGINIAPLEVEQILLNHPGIANVAVVGIPDTRLDERACACIILEEGHTITLDDVTKWMNKAGVTKQKWPEKVEIFDIFPLSVFGRVQKFEVRK
jgi:cyclohexanecarboxylate-CoA ligase